MPVGTEELESGSLRLPCRGELAVTLESVKSGVRDAGIGIARLREMLVGDVGDAEFDPTAGAFRRLCRLGRLAADFVPVGAEKLDHGAIPAMPRWCGSCTAAPAEGTAVQLPSQQSGSIMGIPIRSYLTVAGETNPLCGNGSP